MSTATSPRKPPATGGSPFAQHNGNRARKERRLIERYHLQGDLAAREELICRFLPLARQLAARSSRGESLDDVFQVASAALVKGVDRYDPANGAALSSYLVPTILGEIRRHFRDHHWAMHMPRDMHDRMMSARSASDALWQRLGRAPKPREVADELGISVEEAIELYEAGTAMAVRSLDAPRAGRGDDEESEDLAATIGGEDERFETIEDRSVLVSAIRALPERERTIVKLRFEDQLLQHQIGERLGISQMHVSRLLRRALERLRTIAEASVAG